MKRITRLASALALSAVLALSLCLVGCGGSSEEEQPAPQVKEQTVGDEHLITPGTLTVGLDYTYAPFAGETNGQVIGIDADVAAALADEMGLKVAYIDISEMGGEQALANGLCDIFLSFDRTTASNSTATYLGTYIYDAPSLFALSTDGSVPEVNLADMTGNTIAAQQDSVTAVTVASRYGSAVLQNQPSLIDAFGTLESGGANYAAASGVVGKYIIQSYDDIVWVGALTDAPTEIGIGGDSARVDLNTAVQEALQTIGGNGVLTLVISKWIGDPITFPGYDTVNINTVATASAADQAAAEQAAAEQAAAEAAAAEAAAAEAPAEEAPAEEAPAE